MKRVAMWAAVMALSWVALGQEQAKPSPAAQNPAAQDSAAQSVAVSQKKSVVLVFDDGRRGNGVACLQNLPARESDILPCPLPETYPLFLRQGGRTELQVFHRKFMTDYSITINAVTQIQSGPNIRNLNEAENLSLSNPTLVTLPTTKGGGQGLTARSGTDIVFQLLDESTASKPQADLESDWTVLEREREQIEEHIQDFEKRYDLLRGDPTKPASQITLGQALGSPEVHSVWARLYTQLESISPHCGAGCDWNGNEGFHKDAEFSKLNTRVQDLVAAVITLGGELANADLPKRVTDLDTLVAQYENDMNTFHANAQVAEDAAKVLLNMPREFRRKLRQEQLKVLLSQQLKGSDSKLVLDDAEMNELVSKYQESNFEFVEEQWRQLQRYASGQVRRNVNEYCAAGRCLVPLHRKIEVELPTAIADLNATQGKLLNRVNYIYDHSEVRDPLPKEIDLSGHSGNLVVYYTIRRIENFQRYTVAQVQGPGGSAPTNPEGTPLPASAAAAPQGAVPGPTTAPGTTGITTATATTTTATPAAPATQSTTTTATTTTPAGTTPGIVMARGSFEVHEVYHANVMAAIAWSSLKDESVTKLAMPSGCSAAAGNPDANCFSPQVSYSFKWTPIVGLDYYLEPRDSFPRFRAQKWLCREHPAQCFGVMGAASVTKANSYFFGGFFEPALGVQASAGVNFGIRTALQSPYMKNTAVDITGDFPTTDKRGTGFFVSAGLDLGIFRKVFGKFTGIGATASGTTGQ